MMFTSLEQRMAQTYLDMLPPFVPDENGPEDQRRFYDLMQRLYQLLYDDPALLAPALHADDAHPNRFNKSSYGKPALVKDMRKFLGPVDALLAKLFALGAGQEGIKLTGREKAVLKRLGIDASAQPFPAWAWMASKPGANLLTFTRCFFRQDYPYVEEVFARLLGDVAALRKLGEWLKARGYTRIPSPEGDFSVVYANLAWDAVPPTRALSLYKIRHTGISLTYDQLVQHPPLLGLFIPGNMRQNLEAFNRMDDALQAFVMRQTKQCDICGYCTQTDKTGRRPPANTVVSHLGKEYAMCTYFPGYAYSWQRIDGALVDQIIAMLAFMDALGMDAERA